MSSPAYSTKLKNAGGKGGVPKMQKHAQLNEFESSDNVDACQRCKNLYVLIWLKESDDYNDFGDRYCPFCGLQTDVLTGGVIS